ncbi:hypothetical protein CC86DRAFT_412201 [Ophiobolus disseminans]|uniref:Uncharacterized protein n=1 Tax=Ophiobolus disseminans TaxID=1469910 RepID=A0A6A6ZH77_9PLEO|nr:hypothetical protein CC86DRAFT_412201 [Ophiobolus disseminans]
MSSRHLVPRPHLIAQIYMTPVPGPPHSLLTVRDRWDWPPRAVCSLGIVPDTVRPNGVLRARCSLIIAAVLPFLIAKIVIHASGKTTALLLLPKDDPAAMDPSAPAFTPCVLTQFADQ